MPDRRVFFRDYGPPLRDERQRRRERRRRIMYRVVPVLILLAVAVVLLHRPALRAWRLLFPPAPRTAAPRVPFPLEVTTDKDEYFRYDLVRARVRYVNAGGKPIRDEPPDVRILENGQPAESVGGIKHAPLRFDEPSGTWVVRWPVPWNAPPADYVLRARAQIDADQWEWLSVDERRRLEREQRRLGREPPKVYDEGESHCVATAPFRVAKRKPAAIAPGLGVLTLETTWNLPSIRLPRPDGSEGDWRVIFDWCEYIGANALWYRAGYTDARGRALTLQRPWLGLARDQVAVLAEEARNRRVSLGPYMYAYRTEGPRAQRPDYDYACDYRAGRGVHQTAFVSLLDGRRVTHMADFATQMRRLPGVELVGVDYLRTDGDGYEMVDEFVRDLSVEVPPGWDAWPRAQRMKWLQTKVEVLWNTNRDLYDRWNWFRARKTALIVRQIVDADRDRPRDAKLDGRFYAFTLSWMHGKQHGQDPAMLVDAGLGLDAVMLYQVQSQEHFDVVVRSWSEYARRGQFNLVVGDQVDWFWHQSTKVPAGPEELYNRLRRGTKMIQGDLAKGVFVHDLRRVISSPRRGPYPGTEWALAAAAAITALRADWAVQPAKVSLEAPRSAAIGVPFQARVAVKNVGGQPLDNVVLRLHSTAGVQRVGRASVRLPTIPSNSTEVATFRVRLPRRAPARASRFMVAVRASWPEAADRQEPAPVPPVAVVMRYVNGR
ncbi:MAG: hypothetical protein PVH68_01310 [Armatimonadota bacterium]|jgi:hypothetical protein